MGVAPNVDLASQARMTALGPDPYFRSRTCPARRRRTRFVGDGRGPSRVITAASDPRIWDSLGYYGRAAFDRLEVQRKGLPRPDSHIGNCQIGPTKQRVGRVITAPALMSLEAARAEVLGLIYEYRWRMHVEPRLKSGVPGMTSIDLGQVARLDLDAALVLTAEYHRNCTQSNYRPWVDDGAWAPETIDLLEQLGFYDFMQARGRSATPRDRQMERRFVRFVSGRKVLGEKADHLIDALKAVGGETPAREAVYAALVEAIMNVTNHAYRDRPPEVFNPTEQWWAAGAYDPESQRLEFVVYDQGVGIPVRLPLEISLFDKVRAFLRGTGESDIIAAGIEFGQTSTELPERGNGLWMICRLAEELDGSSVRILSGRGDLTFISGRGVAKKQDHANPFCGTLIKWTLQLPTDRVLKAGETT